MEPHWVNVFEREPVQGKEVQVLVVQRTTTNGYAIEYGRATLTPTGWLFGRSPHYTNVVAWLESDSSLSRDELSNVPKDRIRF